MNWIKIDDYDYSINELGEIKIDKSGKIMKNHLNNRGYYSVSLSKNGKKKNFLLHRLLAKYFLENYSEDLYVDHIDKNRQNNNLENLRMVNNQQNTSNQTKQKNCSSIYKGVHFFKRVNKWQSYIMIYYKRIHLGYFDTELEAAQTYNNYIDENNLIYYSKNII
jgi:hypothetical protein